MHIRPVLTYGSDCWHLAAKYDSLLETLEIRILRKIMGQLRQVIYGDQGSIMNCTNYVMKQKQRRSLIKEY
jgi:hypothetical protein